MVKKSKPDDFLSELIAQYVKNPDFDANAFPGIGKDRFFHDYMAFDRSDDEFSYIHKPRETGKSHLTDAMGYLAAKKSPSYTAGSATSGTTPSKVSLDEWFKETKEEEKHRLEAMMRVKYPAGGLLEPGPKKEVVDTSVVREATPVPHIIVTESEEKGSW